MKILARLLTKLFQISPNFNARVKPSVLARQDGVPRCLLDMYYHVKADGFTSFSATTVRRKLKIGGKKKIVSRKI
jgi:hypothetical protein